MNNKQSKIEQCYKKSIDLLYNNSNEYGIMASAVSPLAKSKHHHHLFGRDTSISALGLISTLDKKNLKLARTSLLSLSKVQSPMGQIPFSYDFKTGDYNYWLPGNLDSTLWWIICSLIYIEKVDDLVFVKKVSEKISKAFVWLSYQDQNEDGLLEQGEASDWADEMPNRGVVLYSNILWFKALDLYEGALKKLKQNKIKLPTSKEVQEGVNTILWQPNIKNNDYYKKNPYVKRFIASADKSKTSKSYFLNYFNHREFGVRCDLYSNILAILFGLATKKQSDQIIKFILNNKLNQPYPVIVYYPPIEKDDLDWTSYLMHREQNYPWQYHNGGIWPYIGGFWVTMLSITGNKKLASDELEKLVASNELNNWEFNEFMHGKNGKPMGVKKQSWNAGTFILAYQSINHGFKL